LLQFSLDSSIRHSFRIDLHMWRRVAHAIYKTNLKKRTEKNMLYPTLNCAGILPVPEIFFYSYFYRLLFKTILIAAICKQWKEINSKSFCKLRIDQLISIAFDIKQEACKTDCGNNVVWAFTYVHSHTFATMLSTRSIKKHKPNTTGTVCPWANNFNMVFWKCYPDENSVLCPSACRLRLPFLRLSGAFLSMYRWIVFTAPHPL
jgi:hypothetical protein